MNRFILNTSEQEKEISDKLNFSETKIFDERLIIGEPFALPEALGEYDLRKVMQNLAGRNISASDAVCFLGAGVYDHFVPSVVNKMAMHTSAFLNTEKDYTKYNGILQAIYEYQIMLQNLTGMKYVNTQICGMSEALANSLNIATDVKGKKKIAVSRAMNPEYKDVLKIYCNAYSVELVEIALDDGATSLDALLSTLDENFSAVMVQSPNYFGIIEDMDEISAIAHKKDAILIVAADPLSLAILKTPAEYNSDIAIGNLQPFGGTLSYGSHYAAYLGVNVQLSENLLKGYVTKIDDNTFGIDGKPYSADNYLPRLVAGISGATYLASMGEAGLKETAKTCYSNARYTHEKLIATSAFKPLFNKPFFREFAVKATKKNVNDINIRMLDYGMIGGLALKNNYPEIGNAWLVAVSEKRSADEVELFVKEASRSI